MGNIKLKSLLNEANDPSTYLHKYPKVGDYWILSNQYMPGGVTKTYYYIVDKDGKTFHHKDKKWRNKELRDMGTYSFGSEEQAKQYINKNLKN